MASDRVMVSSAKLHRISDAIQEKGGASESLTLDEMPDAIRAISGGGAGGVTVTVTTESSEFYGKNVTLTDGVDTMTAKFSNVGFAVFEGVEMEGTLTVSVTVGEETTSTTVVVQSHYNVEVNAIPKIYGVYWDGSTTTEWTRTDDAADFEDPSASYYPSGGTEVVGNSPFDNIYPWSEMKRVEHPDLGTLVKIPKFYVKITQNGGALRIQVSKDRVEGFSVCPACMDRGDGKGERDYVYVSRYKCAATNFKSTSGEMPKISATLKQFNDGINALNGNAWVCDLSVYMTIRILYIVEYANWFARTIVGGGEENISNSGDTDKMHYHTGTTTGGARNNTGHVQYRNIEDLWSGGYEWCEGLKFLKHENGYQYYYVSKNPASRTWESAYRRSIASSGFITKMAVSDVSGYENFLFPAETNGSSNLWSKYTTDKEIIFDSARDSGPVNVGGMYNSGYGRGLFYQETNASFNRYDDYVSRNDTSARLMLLP